MHWTSLFSSAAQLMQAKINVRADVDACLVSKQVSKVLRNIVCGSSDPSIGCHVLPCLAQKLSDVSGETHYDVGANVPLIQHPLTIVGETHLQSSFLLLPQAVALKPLLHCLAQHKQHLSTTSNISPASGNIFQPQATSFKPLHALPGAAYPTALSQVTLPMVRRQETHWA